MQKLIVLFDVEVTREIKEESIFQDDGLNFCKQQIQL